jgi:hypothetical protein
MLRSEVTTGLNALRYMLEKASGFQYSSEDDKEYYDEVLTEAIRAVLLNEQNDPHAPHMR